MATLTDKLLCRVYSSSSNKPKDNMPETNPQETLDKFIAQAPAAKYTFDGERGAEKSEICRVGKDGQSPDCIWLHMQSTKLFEKMTAKGFFCALPMDPTRTHMECTPLPKS